MLDESYEEIKTRVLTDNTAQGVLNHLKALESNRGHVRTRWVWELLQNARDASANSTTRLIASVEHSQAEIIFRHNGANFKIDEIAHLVYHGSTKVESVETLGQYGSGFLTTHLLSPEIDVSGQLNNGKYFEFQLKREVGSVSELSESMDRAWSDFNRSLSESALTADEFTTEFRYPLESGTLDVVEEGIATLKRCGPFVVAFNREFSSIEIKSLAETTAFKVIERTQLKQKGLQQITVAGIENGNRSERKFLLAQGNKASVAIPMKSIGTDEECLSVCKIPRLFLGFPLVGTENFSFPAVINSLSFTPTENRDGVYLWQGVNDANHENQAVIEEACELLVNLLQFAASSGRSKTYVLANIPSIREQGWLDPNKLRKCLNEQLIERIRQTPAVLCECGAVTPEASVIPFSQGDAGSEALWDLLYGMKGCQRKLPRRIEAAGWRDAVNSWVH